MQASNCPNTNTTTYHLLASPSSSSPILLVKHFLLQSTMAFTIRSSRLPNHLLALDTTLTAPQLAHMHTYHHHTIQAEHIHSQRVLQRSRLHPTHVYTLHNTRPLPQNTPCPTPSALPDSRTSICLVSTLIPFAILRG